MGLLIESAKQIVTCHARRHKFKSGKYQSQLGIIENSSIYIEGNLIKWIGKKFPSSIVKSVKRKIDAKNKIVMPGFIDSHTHLVFAGDRLNEFAMRIEGKSYQQIARAGGGILNTVKATRKASKEELKKLALKRIRTFLEFGVTTLEAKSGYGLDSANEIKMLEVIDELRSEQPVELFSTFLGAHSFPKDKSRKEYLEEMLYETIPAVSKGKLAKFIDVFCEKNYFSPKETNWIFKQGVKFGLIPKLHTNQFYSIGGIKTAVENNAISVDHLEVMKEFDIATLKGTGTIACLLPGVSYFLDIPYAPARKLIENNIPISLATDFNPGSCMTENIQLIMSLAVHKLKMRIEEVINAVTINAAASLGISDIAGSIEVGKQADILIFDVKDYRELLYYFGVNQLETVIKKGKKVN